MMSKIISMLRYDKVRQRSISTVGSGDNIQVVDHGEYISSQVHMTGTERSTPHGETAVVKSIERAEDNNRLCYAILFSNGEELHVYPTEPFDVAYDIVTEEEDNQKQ